MTKSAKKHDKKKTELLNSAQRLFLRNGYENTSVASIIDAVGKAKGTFYHYFRSKEELLEQVVDRQLESISQMSEPVIADSKLNALEKLNALYSLSTRFNVATRDTTIMLVKAFYADNNIRLLDKFTKKRIKTFAPILSKVISQGVAEGVFHTGNVQYVSEIILHVDTHLAEEFARIVMRERPNREDVEIFLEKNKTYVNIVERILGAPEGSLAVFDIDTFLELLGNA